MHFTYSLAHVFFLLAYVMIWYLYLLKHKSARQKGGTEARRANIWLAIPILLGFSIWNAVTH